MCALAQLERTHTMGWLLLIDLDYLIITLGFINFFTPPIKSKINALVSEFRLKFKTQ